MYKLCQGNEFPTTHCQKRPTDCVMVKLEFGNDEKDLCCFISAITTSPRLYEVDSLSHIYLLIYCRPFLPCNARSAKWGIAIVSRPSVCLSVCLSVMLMYRGHTCWVSSKVITQIISLGSSLPELQHWQSRPRHTPKFGWNWGGVAVLNRKPAISLKGSKIGPIGSCIRAFS